jgi:hypothetical protein
LTGADDDGDGLNDNNLVGSIEAFGSRVEIVDADDIMTRLDEPVAKV